MLFSFDEGSPGISQKAFLMFIFYVYLLLQINHVEHSTSGFRGSIYFWTSIWLDAVRMKVLAIAVENQGKSTNHHLHKDSFVDCDFILIKV